MYHALIPRLKSARQSRHYVTRIKYTIMKHLPLVLVAVGVVLAASGLGPHMVSHMGPIGGTGGFVIHRSLDPIGGTGGF